MIDDRPVLDDHLHLDPDNNRGIDAVRDFARVGGTHLLVVNKPSWHLGVEAETGADFREVFERTIDIVEAASSELEGRAWPVLGVHPGLITRLVDERDFSPDEARDLMQAGIDVAAEYVEAGDALALKSGRPHYEVDDDVWAASNAVMRRAFDHGADLECAVQLHAEASEDMTEVANWAEAAGMEPHRVVKHYASGRLEGPTPSVMSDKERLETAAERGEPFLMETDYIDDPDRPGAVLGPKTVPRRVRWLLENGYDEAVEIAHVETPKAVYGIDTEATLE
ncbi:TatD-related deoxyribonuclease [Natrinema pellirubrum DSM 15624]|uniref:Metal-dependent hydrolase (Urease superfamily) n=1 Tax=Natrinema pellirubrum (strain DSM 15624 / CIP 106293 / JCM 10476 / NCIMB 786 / 157) TaxID=797303 RepID=L0JJM6_NATP1|nr:TatD family hydrolase [Natrinema pellirubrum]AGB31474.1 putative metal-dependent hydrolase (urease superfamily) [Natrinema pellirubrum DSM 15624]ELY82154.1 TatD-related deoxyribonuclease [Natrinema pellirubrum DSM 15624]